MSRSLTNHCEYHSDRHQPLDHFPISDSSALGLSPTYFSLSQLMEGLR
jgi:hypothetical protein